MRTNYLTRVFRKDHNELLDCPRCGRPLPIGHCGALSRKDNETELCSECGVAEAFEGIKRVSKKDEQ